MTLALPASAPASESDRPRGLTASEVAARRAAGEGNDYRQPTSRTYVEILRQNAYPGINGPLIVISLLLLAAGMVVESLLTAGPVLANIGIGVVQEVRAKRKLDRIALLTRPRVTVVRDGLEREVDPAEIVRGDLLVVRRGDQLVVDGTLAGDGSVELDESLLTGESDPVAKRAGDPVFSGTAVISGTGLFVAERVGRSSVANRLLDEARALRKEQTPLQREIARTIWAVAGLVVLAAFPVALAIPSLDPQYLSSETLQAAAVLVTLVPQGLAIMVTVTYAAGALRITHLGALVQQQRAVESMSRVDTLCLDKTGTLTTQRISFEGAEPVGAEGTGPDGDEVRRLLAVFAASTTARNRTTDALAVAQPGIAIPLAEEIPFASERRWSALRFADPGASAAQVAAVPGSSGSGLPALSGDAFVLGAPLALVPAIGQDHAELREGLATRVAELAATGRRVLLFARAPAEAPLRDAADQPALPPGLRPLALLTFTEELRGDAHETLGRLVRAGVHLKVISGDDPTTVEAIGSRVGLSVEGTTLAGPDLVGLDDDALADAADRSNVFGRVDPGLKARLVGALRRRGHYVAMIGDGVNDLLPLRRAQLGIAMESGSPATRGAADLVLLGDAFGVLPRAVVEGQRIIAAMEATLVLLLSRTFYVLLIVAGAALLGLPFPMTPRQNSVLAFATVGIPLIVLALWVPPRRLPSSLLGETLRISIPASLAVTVLALPLYAYVLGSNASLDEARTSLTTITVFCGLGLLPLIRPSREEGAGRFLRAWPWLLSAAMLVVYVAILQIPLARDFYELTPVPVEVLIPLIGMGAAWTLLVHLIRATGVVRRAEDRLGAIAGRSLAVVRRTAGTGGGATG